MKIRKTEPKNNKYYVRQVSGGLNGAVEGYPVVRGENVLCNCVGYANGRFNEIINDPNLKGVDKKFKYQLVCNAENFIEAAKRQGLKISKTPIEGGIMVWQKGATLSSGDGAGHVEVVEQVYEDGSILCSSSGWAGWAFRTMKRTNSNGNWGQASPYRFRGCIINPSVKDPKVVPIPPLEIDGIGGVATVSAMQRFFGTTQDGVISGQIKSLEKYFPSFTSVTWGGGGSNCVKKLQKWLGVAEDGTIGKETVKAWQKKLGLTVDGVFGKKSMKAWQKYLNENEKADFKAKTSNKVIDVSYVQSAIDWKKVKADGIQGAIVRCGYRGYGNGKLREDDMFMKHITGAHKAGLKVGVYFFTEAITAKEGKEEAAYTLNLVKKAGIPLAYPIAVDTEHINASGVRANDLSKSKRTACIKAFCEEIKRQGYTPMIYASTSWLNNQLDMSKLPYDVWCAQYYKVCEYKGKYVMWQYTSEGRVDGVKGNVDISRSYLK